MSEQSSRRNEALLPARQIFRSLRLKRHLDELPRDRNIVLYCGTGGRAGKAKEVLDAAGFKAFNGGGYKTILKILESK